jgi:hypothetical protein
VAAVALCHRPARARARGAWRSALSAVGRALTEAR